jgi:hypothetical protein
VPQREQVEAQRTATPDRVRTVRTPTPSPLAARVAGLQRSAGNRATAQLLRDLRDAPGSGSGSSSGSPARRSFVFIMGADRGGFYTYATRYWRAHLPDAVFVTRPRNLAALLDWIRTNVPEDERMGELIIVSHANEDGTLSFGLNDRDRDGHLSFHELSAALAQGALPQVGPRIDAQTQIKIKGCDIGRSPEMLNLVDRAFGGLGTVTAPTHEQAYGIDSTLRDRAIAAETARIRAEVEAANPEPDEVDPALRGTARRRAQQERARALSARRRAIAAEMRRRRSEITRAGELAMTYEGFSGPMFQRPGTDLFTEDELRTQVDALYPHLSERQRESLARRLVAADRRARATQQRQGTYQQTGQRLDRRELFIFTHTEPQSLAEARRAFASTIRRNRLTPTDFTIERQPVDNDGFTTHAVLTGEVRRRGRDPQEMTLTFDSAPGSAIPTDESMMRQARERVANPEKFAWRMDTQHRSDGTTRRTVIAERVISYLHHGSLDVSAHEHFTRPESDPTFFARSTFQPAPAQPARGRRPARVP